MRVESKQEVVRVWRAVVAWSVIVPCLLVLSGMSACATQSYGLAPPRTPSHAGADTVSLSTLPSLGNVVDATLPSVVYILSEPAPGDTRGSPKSGSGVVLRPDGYILTNKHVIDGGGNVEVTLSDRRVSKATGVWADDIMDLAVVKVDGSRLPTAEFGEKNTVRVGDWVLALGHALGMSPGQGGATVTLGIVSNLGRSFTIDKLAYYDLIQTDAAINHGNSGGPLVNLQGKVVGVNSVLVDQAQSIGYAINANTARHVFDDLVKYGTPKHPFIGIEIEDAHPLFSMRIPGVHPSGAVIRDIKEGSPAYLAGLLPGDIILGFAGDEINSAAAVIQRLWGFAVGDAFDVIIWRDGAERRVRLKTEDRPKCGHL